MKWLKRWLNSRRINELEMELTKSEGIRRKMQAKMNHYARKLGEIRCGVCKKRMLQCMCWDK